MSYETIVKNIDEFKELIANDNRQEVAAILDELHPADIAEMMDDLNVEEAKYIYLLLEGEKASDVLIEIDEDDRRKFLKVLPPGK